MSTDTPPQGLADTDADKLARLPNVLGHYAKAIRRLNALGSFPVDSDLAPILERASNELRRLSALQADAIVPPRIATEAMLKAGYEAAAFPSDPEICAAMWTAMWDAAIDAARRT